MKYQSWPICLPIWLWCLTVSLTTLTADPPPPESASISASNISVVPFAVPALRNLSPAWQSWEVRTVKGPRFVFRLHLPQSQRPVKPLGLLVYLDGSGSAGYDNIQQMRHPKMNALFEGPNAIPLVVLVPQIPDMDSWDALVWSGGPKPLTASAGPAPYLQLLMALIQKISAGGWIDPTRIIIAGHSLGAFGALDAVIHYPGRFSACVAMAGGSDPEALSRSAGKTRILLFHGRLDNNVPFDFSARLAQGLQGKDIQLIEFPEAGHGIVELVIKHPVFRKLLSDLVDDSLP